MFDINNLDDLNGRTLILRSYGSRNISTEHYHVKCRSANDDNMTLGFCFDANVCHHFVGPCFDIVNCTSLEGFQWLTVKMQMANTVFALDFDAMDIIGHHCNRTSRA